MQSKTCQTAAVRLMLRFPFFSELYYSMSVVDDEALPTLATDGRTMWVNPTFWNTLSLDLKIAALAHEVGHKMLLHSSRRGGRDPKLWNIAADYVVNGILALNGFQLGKDWLYDAKYDGWATEAVYAALEKQAKPQQKPEQGEGEGEGGSGQGEGEGEGEGEGGSGQGMQVPGVPDDWADKWMDIRELSGSPEQVEKAEREIIQQVQKAQMTAKAMGSQPAGMKAFDDVCEPSREPWYNHLHRYMQSLTMAEYNWARMNRRHLVQHRMFAPANYSEALEHVVFAIDCSGSVFDAASQANFAGHVNAILAETKPKRTHVLYFDTRVARHDELDYGQVDFSTRPTGGGGTDFRPVFEHLENEGIVPEVVVFLTDCYGGYPDEAPDYPVVWCSIEAPESLGSYAPPFGDVIHVEG